MSVPLPLVPAELFGGLLIVPDGSEPMPNQPKNLMVGRPSGHSASGGPVRAVRRARSAQLVLEGGVFAVAAMFAVWSAVNAKQSQMGPLLAAVEATGRGGAPKATIPFVAATSDRAVRETTSGGSEPAGPVDGPPEEIGSKPSFGLGTFTPASGATRYFDGRPIRPKKTIWMTVTGYSPDERSCGDWADGRTATNHSVWTNGMNLVAADPKLLPYGSILTVPGYAEDEVVPVLDCGGAIKGNRLDLLYPTHGQALKWGVKRVKVTVWEYADKAS